MYECLLVDVCSSSVGAVESVDDPIFSSKGILTICSYVTATQYNSNVKYAGIVTRIENLLFPAKF